MNIKILKDSIFGVAVGFLLFTASGMGVPARADILFVDFNGAGTEIAAAERAAASRGEKLWIIPEIPKAARSRIAATEGKLHRARREMERATRAMYDSGLTEHEREKRMLQFQASVEKVGTLQEKLHPLIAPYRFDSQALEAKVSELERSGASIRSIVFSGHSSGEDFEGALGKLSVLEAKRIFREKSPLQGAIEGIYLWGCYTGTRSATLQWKGIFPEATVVMGFNERAPTDQTRASPEILEAALLKESELTRVREVEQAEEMLRSLEHARSFPLAALVNECHVGTKVKPSVTSQEDVKCSGLGLVVREETERIFEATRLGTENRSVNPEERNASLRAFYNKFQSSRHCESVKALYIDPRSVIALIHSQEVLENAVARHRTQLLALQNLVADYPGKGPLMEEKIQKLLDLSATRKDIRELSDALDQASIPVALDREWDPAERVRALVIHDALQPTHSEALLLIRRHLLDLKCIPMSWYERPIPGVVPEAIDCRN